MAETRLMTQRSYRIAKGKLERALVRHVRAVDDPDRQPPRSRERWVLTIMDFAAQLKMLDARWLADAKASDPRTHEDSNG